MATFRAWKFSILCGTDMFWSVQKRIQVCWPALAAAYVEISSGVLSFKWLWIGFHCGLWAARLAPHHASRSQWLLWGGHALRLHILSVSNVGKPERPLACSVRNPTTKQTQSRASLTHHFHSLKQVSFPHPSSLMEPSHHYRLNNRHSGHSCLYD